jgi:hypothetical protein
MTIRRDPVATIEALAVRPSARHGRRWDCLAAHGPADARRGR